MTPPRQLRLFDLLPGRRRRDGEGGSQDPQDAGRRAPAPAPPRRTRIRPRGRCSDLSRIAEELNRRFFGGELTARITWGRRRPRRRSRRRRTRRVSMQLGSYHPDQDLVRVHPALDQPWVPRYVLEAVIYHELLHAALPPVERNGRRRIHTPEFRRRERLYPHLDRAQHWVEQNLPRLIEAA